MNYKDAYKLGYNAYDWTSHFLKSPFKGKEPILGEKYVPADEEYILGRHWIDGHVQAIIDSRKPIIDNDDCAEVV